MGLFLILFVIFIALPAAMFVLALGLRKQYLIKMRPYDTLKAASEKRRLANLPTPRSSGDTSPSSATSSSTLVLSEHPSAAIYVAPEVAQERARRLSELMATDAQPRTLAELSQLARWPIDAVVSALLHLDAAGDVYEEFPDDERAEWKYRLGVVARENAMDDVVNERAEAEVYIDDSSRRY